MGSVRLLPEIVANQIAAGEVVERPASVVKELVENALDAGPTRITVDIQAGGRSLIRVADNGSGMDRDDALLCLERHATSKIQVAEDLASIDTMGFRGEAIPSIASVSRMALTTLASGNETGEGTRIDIHAGKIRAVESAGHAGGTTIEVRSLFYNLPARRKFLRTPETERSHIQHFLTLAALANPAVGFVFTSDQRKVWELPPCRVDDTPASHITAVRERMAVLHGEGISLLNVDSSGDYRVAKAIPDDPGVDMQWDGQTTVRTWGLIGAPGVSRSTRANQHLFVNRRPIENRSLNRALIEGYHTALMKGQFPLCCLFIEIDPGEVDVNIHPAKREVKFHHERDVRRLLTQAVQETLLAFHSQKPKPTLIPVDEAVDVMPISTVAIPVQAELGDQSPTAVLDQAQPGPPQNESVRATPLPAPAGAPVPLLHVPLRLVGVVGKLYVVLESDKGLVLLDQHAAHERVLYEQMLRRMESEGSAASQKLLLPETVELPPREARFLSGTMGSLNRLGVGLSEFGERTFLLDALPPFVKAADSRKFILELVDKLQAAGEGVNALRLGEDVIIKTVCRHAVKANDALREEELQNLVDDLRRCEMPYTCPHGRPTIIEMNYLELEKKFGRIQ
ncbi:MAG: DNA mismatch repair endonuclease MutL [Verrucomicrobiota bacterium]|jgi:DNA mismatch repair protein MutL|nr:DNA mismatch repair endonuclease MutL [Verrucomicrobiota bacterium]